MTQAERDLILALHSLKEDAGWAHTAALNGELDHLGQVGVSMKRVEMAVIAWDAERTHSAASSPARTDART